MEHRPRWCSGVLSPSDTLYTSTQNVMSGSVLGMSREKGGCQVRVIEEQLIEVSTSLTSSSNPKILL